MEEHREPFVSLSSGGSELRTRFEKKKFKNLTSLRCTGPLGSVTAV